MAIAVLAASVSAREPVKVSFGASAAFNINIAGDWHDTNPQDDIVMDYGAGIGAVCNVSFCKSWFGELGATINYDDLHSADTFVHFQRLGLRFPLAVGYDFSLGDLKLAPMAAVCFSQSLKTFGAGTPPSLVSAGIGARLSMGRYAVEITSLLGMTSPTDNTISVAACYYF